MNLSLPPEKKTLHFSFHHDCSDPFSAAIIEGVWFHGYVGLNPFLPLGLGIAYLHDHHEARCRVEMFDFKHGFERQRLFGFVEDVVDREASLVVGAGKKRQESAERVRRVNRIGQVSVDENGWG